MHSVLGELPRILVFAYACEPGRGSEPGAGWAVVQGLARVANCTVLVGPEHSAGLQHWLDSSPMTTNLTFVEVAEPAWGGLAKGHRLTWFPLYLVWLRRAYEKAVQMHRERPFDLTYHATYSAFWLPSPAISLGVPSIWGPVGGAVVTPWPLWRLLRWRGLLGEILDAVAIRAFTCLPATRQTWRQATVRLVQNDATLGSLPASLRGRTRVLNHATLIQVPPLRRLIPSREILFVGPLEHRKGVALAVRSMTYTPADIRLVIVGDGPQRPALERLAHRLGVAHRIEFAGRVDREQVFQLWARAAGAVFTGLREEGGLALAEAMQCGVPVVVLAHGGARTIAEAALDPSLVALIKPGPLPIVARAMGEAMTRFCNQDDIGGRPNLDFTKALHTLHAAVAEALNSGVAERSPPPE